MKSTDYPAARPKEIFILAALLIATLGGVFVFVLSDPDIRAAAEAETQSEPAPAPQSGNAPGS